MKKKLGPSYRLLKVTSLLLVAMSLALSGIAQQTSVNAQKTIEGTVTDETGVPIAGVTVTVNDGQSSTLTDNNGHFSIRYTGKNPSLVFTSIGFEKIELKSDHRNVVNVTMKNQLQSLDDVVVIGYGTQKREKVIGSIAQVTGEQINKRPVSQLKNALTGQLPGVTIIQRNGSPGVGSGTISVRGVGSFGASPSALVLVDGTPVENFNDIDPNDVETISVLKDASSAAIYGSRAANGVILVTTKSGKSGKAQVTYNSYVGIQTPTSMPEYVNSWEYQQAFFEAQNGSSTLTAAQTAIVEKYKAGNDPDYPNTDFLRSVISKNGLQTGQNISVSGGTSNNKYNISMGYLYQDGIVIQNNYSRYNLRVNMNTALSPKLDLTTRIASIISRINEPQAPAGTNGFSGDMLGIIGQAARLPNSYIGKYENGDFGPGLGNTGTPISNLATNSFDKQKNLNLNGNLRLDYKVIRNLKLSFITSYVQNNGRETSFRSTQRINNNITIGPNFVREYANSNEYYTLQGIAEYTKQIRKHNIGVLAGYSFENYASENFNAFRDNLPGNDLTVLNIGSPNNQQANGNGAAYALESEFGRINYSYSGRYLLEGVLRRDGSSRFPSNQKYAMFPSVAAGWRLGQEKFIMDHFSWISELKLKASYGTLGNQNISNYPFQNTLVSSNATNGGTSYSFGGNIAQGAARTTLVDSTLHWESTRTKDIGIEGGIFKNKLTFSATWFDRYTYDILYSPSSSVSNVLGFNLSQRNTGKLKNSGWEFTAAHMNTIGKFSYNVNANFTIVNNEVLDLGVGNINQPNGLVGNGSDLFIGYPNSNGSFALYYGYVADGLFVNQADIDEWPSLSKVNPAPKPGDIRYKDISGPDGKPDGIVDATYDRVVLGSQIPKYSYGVNLGANYAGFDVSALMQGIADVKGRLQGYASWAFYNTTGNIQRFQYEGRWTDQNPDPHAKYPRVETIPNTGVPNTLQSSFWILDGSYLRIKNVQLGYTIPTPALQRVKISKARIYVSGENLHTFSHYAKGWDPEINTGTSTEFYPILSTYTIGLNVTF